MATNYALSSNGATAAATSQYSAAYAPSYAIDGTRAPYHWDAGGVWNSVPVPSSGSPEILTVDFGASRTITEIDVITVRDSFYDTSPLTLTETFSAYGNTDFTVEYWNGSSWINIATVTGNNKVWRQFTFAPLTTTKIRVRITGAVNAARIAELEAWGSVPLAFTSTSPLPSATVGVAYTPYQLTASGGTTPYSWSDTDGDFAAHGLSLSSSGLITFTPATVGLITGLTVGLSDASGTTILTSDFSLTVNPNPNFYWNQPKKPFYYFASLVNFDEVTKSRRYQDKGASFNVVNPNPGRTWDIVYTGINRKTTAGAAAEAYLDAHYNSKGLATPFDFHAKDGNVYTNVYYKEYTPSHDENKSHIQTRKITLIKYP